MRKYEIEYWFENNDCADFATIIIDALNIEEALQKFKLEVNLYRKITKIIEL